ncbi:hypothetical protein [Actinokineospora diospyrosa]|uniref:Uncharacterized protein n=1 Tax=Actinokineospora diospyrosa TaxID=103728 RepID=A0ABT1IFS5_9PSEU|nr:hypothetical protein [Actinokineospora diospyrosa]MCP2271494.1 hypothetical protein [Actinokineospora diospyrosa]
MTTTTPRPHTPLSTHITAWTVPALILGGFAFLSGIPIAILLFRSRLRWWTGALGLAYAVAMALWLLGPSTEPSLSKYLSPLATISFAALAALVAIAHHIRRP